MFNDKPHSCVPLAAFPLCVPELLCVLLSSHSTKTWIIKKYNLFCVSLRQLFVCPIWKPWLPALAEITEIPVIQNLGSGQIKNIWVIYPDRHCFVDDENIRVLFGCSIDLSYWSSYVCCGASSTNAIQRKIYPRTSEMQQATLLWYIFCKNKRE